MIDGIIISSVAGTYQVHTEEGRYLAKARGIFRLQEIKPAVGDRVRISVHEKEATIEEIKARTNELVRPFVANIDYCLLTFALKDPEPDLVLLDTLIINVLSKGIEPILLFNKTDLGVSNEEEELKKIYEKSGFPVHFFSVYSKEGVEKMFETLPKGIFVLAGQSGVGKSSLLNELLGEELETGSISKKLLRGRHTTRTTSLLEGPDGRYFVDTPGFQSLELEDTIEPIDVLLGYPEFQPYEGHCKFANCTHENEPGCAVKEHLNEFHPIRYKNYVTLQQKLKKRRKY
ncbi:ribosome small subunit-dependent GTPase A [Guggenheimella bovis]